MPLIAQQDYTADIRLYTTEQGLSDNHVYQCFQDHRGLMWLLSETGLTRFDGKQFKLMVNERFNLDYTKNKICFEDSDGDLWISNYSQKNKIEYTLVNTITGNIRNAQQKLGKLLPPNALHIKCGGSGSFWITTTAGELLKITPGKPTKRIYHQPGSIFSVIAVDSVRQSVWLAISDQDGSYDEEYKLINQQGKTICTYKITLLQNGLLDKKGVFRFYTLHDLGSISPDGKLKQQPIQQQLFTYQSQHQRAYELPLAFDPNSDHYWILYANQLHVLDQQKGHLFSATNNNHKLRPKSAYSIFVDRQGIGWICSIEGLYKVKLNPQRFQRLLWENPDEAENPVQLSCRGIVKDEKSATLYVNVSACLWSVKGTEERKIFCRENAIYALAQDEAGAIWMGSEALHRYHPATEETETVSAKIPLDYSIAWSLKPQQKRLWLGLNNGLAYLDKASGKIEFIDQKKSHPALKEAIIHSIMTTSHQQMWLLTEKGLFRFDPQKGILARYWTGGEGKYHLPVENLRTCHQDEKGNWWLATAEGLLRWNPAQGDARMFTTRDGLSNNNIYAAYADAYGYLWLSSDRGIIQFHMSSGKTRTFLPRDGLTHQEFNRISHFQDKDGRIYFGSLNGVTVFHPRDFYQDFRQTPNIPLVLTRAHLFSQPRNALQDVELDYFQSGKILFKPSHLYLTLRFALLDYTAPQSTQYEYRIEGLGNRWAPCPGGILQLAGLPYGHFKLIIRAKTANGLYSREQLSIPIQVLRPYYLQLWFLALLSIVLLGSIIGFFRYRNQWLKNRKVELEREVALQTEKIRQDKAIIEEQSVQLIKLDEAKSRFFANVTHELRTPLTLILGPINTVLETKTLDQYNADLLQMARQHSEGLLETINDLLDLTKLEAGKMDAQERPVLLYRKVRLLLGGFFVHAERKGILLQLDYRAEHLLRVQIDERLFTLILNNLLSNAFKFTEEGGNITLRVIDLVHSIQIEVEDSGSGIHPDDLPLVFERYFQTQHTGTAFEGGTGIGLSLAKESSKVMGAALSVVSTWGEGSVFTLCFPKKEVFGNIQEEEQTELNQLLLQEQSAISMVNGSLAVPETGSTDGQARILLIEDNHDLRQYLTQILAGKYQVRTLGNGREAQLNLEQWMPDLILSDIMMPLMDGFQFLEWLKSSEKHASIPIIMLTARADLGDKLRALRTGVDDYLVKPFVEAELLARIQNLLQRQQLRRGYVAPIVEEPGDLPLAGKVKKALVFTEADKKFLEKLEETILQHLQNPDFTVNDLAKTLLMSRSVFYTEIGRLIGLTPNEYINEIRLNRAREILKSKAGAISIKELASSVGFRDEKYFSRLFKQRYGILPSQMR
ncbi:response regulator [Haliscomenobacter hydrossis]|nr:response regulator [Haliscomenobacter hydrossis]